MVLWVLWTNKELRSSVHNNTCVHDLDGFGGDFASAFISIQAHNNIVHLQLLLAQVQALSG